MISLPVSWQTIRAALAGSHPFRCLTSDAITQLRRLYYDTAGSPFPRQIGCTAENLVDTAQLLYGSDYPWAPAGIAERHTAAFAHLPGPSDATW